MMRRWIPATIAAMAACLAGNSIAAMGEPLGVACESPPPLHCQSGNGVEKVAAPGNATAPATGRQFYLDYACDLEADEPVVFILDIHGAGSIANWQRHYFPAPGGKVAGP